MDSELQRELAKLEQGDHVCLIDEDAAKQMADSVPFMKAGLSKVLALIHTLVAESVAHEPLEPTDI